MSFSHRHLRALRHRRFRLLSLVASIAAFAFALSAPSFAQAASTAKLTLRFDSIYYVHGNAVSVPGLRTVVYGNVSQFVADQTVVVSLSVHGHEFRRAQVRVLPDRKDKRGWFKLAYSVPRTGWVVVKVEHTATTDQAAFTATRNYLSLDENVKPGARGRFVQLIQQRLRALHIYLPASGVYDLHTELALDAYHRLIGWGTSDGLGRATVNHLLLGLGRFHVRFPNQGMHAEGDLSDQVLALINGSQVVALLPISSGKPSTPTILGSFRVYYKQPGYLPDGMYYSSFFYSGYAIHGYDPAPNYPASHGCMRLPIVDAIWVYGWISIGDWVDTYYT